MTSSITRLVLAIKSLETDETLERWQFDVQTEESALTSTNGSKTSATSTTSAGASAGSNGNKAGKQKVKTEKEVQGEIREIMKQITSSVTFLPILEDPCKHLDHPVKMFENGRDIGN